MKCEEARARLALYLYGELNFQEEEDLEAHLEQCSGCQREAERERTLHEAMDVAVPEMAPGLLAASRRELMERVGAARRGGGVFGRWAERLGIQWRMVSPALQPIGAVALLLLGYFGSRLSPYPFGPGAEASLVDPVASRVRYVEPQGSGKVRIVIEEARQRVLTGRVDDDRIRRLLVSAVEDPADPGLRVESVDLLKDQMESADVRRALLSVVQHDANAGVRLKALEGLKTFASDPEMRQTLTRVLLTDKNPGVRSEVVDLLVQHKTDDMVGVLQELMHREENNGVRRRCLAALRELNASAGTF